MGETFLDRLKIERSELNEKTTGLGNFLVSESFEKLSTGNKALLRKQYELMFAYREVLDVRLELLTK
ncbi:hypothetical protein KO02_12310 [Sphingobacterium sp. ML3W]|uniref:crAss001_48 related protein n=1 Tax=Sphingobacterium sp. ML3W TaxID=1538644 RepID=UPI0004F7B9C7|nr:hypothetical protein [Sphingobacterium sp. ML3W]AIM37387.1 hypothetical protein KO02_12310 [Sphingobacterium sp. ML3W]